MPNRLRIKFGIEKYIYNHCAAFVCYNYTPDRLLTGDAIIKFVFAAFLHAFLFHTQHRTAGSNYHRSTMSLPCSKHSKQEYFGRQSRLSTKICRPLWGVWKYCNYYFLHQAAIIIFDCRQSAAAAKRSMENCGMSLIGSWNTLDVIYSNQLPTWPQEESRKRKQQRFTEVPFVSYIVIMISSFQKTKDNGIKTNQIAILNKNWTCFVVVEILCSPNTVILASCYNLNAKCYPRSYHAAVFHRSLHDSDKKVSIKGKYCRMMQEEEVTCNNIALY